LVVSRRLQAHVQLPGSGDALDRDAEALVDLRAVRSDCVDSVGAIREHWFA
jgi:hypothetical protein